MGFDDSNNLKDDEGPLPGFRFHPTDEELVGFYLRRKLEKRPISLQLIKQIDIYKYDPWDLPKAGSSGDEKEWYFFCKRGRKYKNSIRPNRVTGSGFWKATGIDKPVYSQTNDCIIGLKKTLVYHIGSAGKGTKTDWMMHEFRLPSNNNHTNTNTNTNTNNSAANGQETEIWTLCKILKRNVSKRKYTPDLRQYAAKPLFTDKINRMRSVECNANQEAYINFDMTPGNYHNDHELVINNNTNNDHQSHQFHEDHLSFPLTQQPPQLTTPSSNICISPAVNDFFSFENCDELGSVVKFAVDSPIM